MRWLRSKFKRSRRLPSRRDWLLLVIGALIALAGVGVVTLIERAQVPLRPEQAEISSPWIPATVKRWQGPIDAMAKKYDIDPNLIAIIMIMESGGYAQANSGEAVGLMQITPLTAKEIASKYLKKPVTSYNLMDPDTSIEFGAAYLSYLRGLFGSTAQGPSWDSTVELIAAGYNGGPGAAASLEAGEGLTNTQTVVYSRDAFNMWRERHAGDSPTYDRWLERGGTTLINAAKAAKQ
jgi:soluble lytic murein transglycosylase-like protein